MNIKKRLMALVLIAAMVLTTALPVFAASTKSPDVGPETEPANKTFVIATDIDNNQQDHNKQVVVRTLVTSSKVEVQNITHGVGKKPASFVSFNVARDKDNVKHAIQTIGNGKTGVFNSAKGRCVTTAVVNSGASKVTIASNAFVGSKVKTLKLQSKKITVAANAFKGTQEKNAKIYLMGPQRRTAADVTVSKGSFSGLSKTSVFTVTKSTMNWAEYQKLRSKLRSAGFPGIICYKDGAKLLSISRP
ncbi:MAG: hypothetical protein IJG52_04165 [Lachnospiraceae bacterium]|nr:hypothetical protein [Lachnospiraceae bacterium]